ncbi:TPA: CopG family transcriptional regulator [Listeria monocytogenes]
MRNMWYYLVKINNEKENKMSKKKRLTITLSEQVLEYLDKVAKEKGLSKSALITIALEEYKKGQK